VVFARGRDANLRAVHGVYTIVHAVENCISSYKCTLGVSMKCFPAVYHPNLSSTIIIPAPTPLADGWFTVCYKGVYQFHRWYHTWYSELSREYWYHDHMPDMAFLHTYLVPGTTLLSGRLSCHQLLSSASAYRCLPIIPGIISLSGTLHRSSQGITPLV